jgi:hypothetical protein
MLSDFTSFGLFSSCSKPDKPEPRASHNCLHYPASVHNDLCATALRRNYLLHSSNAGAMHSALNARLACADFMVSTLNEIQPSRFRLAHTDKKTGRLATACFHCLAS